MPTDKKRINLTIPDPIYQKLLVFKERNGITNDATACLQLITQQLKSQEESELMLKLLRETPADQLLKLSNQGLAELKEAIDKQGSPTLLAE